MLQKAPHPNPKATTSRRSSQRQKGANRRLRAPPYRRSSSGIKKTQAFVIEVKGDGTVEVTSSGGGGCDAGFGIFALLALGAAIKRRK